MTECEPFDPDAPKRYSIGLEVLFTLYARDPNEAETIAVDLIRDAARRSPAKLLNGRFSYTVQGVCWLTDDALGNPLVREEG